MTANEITDRLILDNQNLVVEELMRHDESLWEELQNFDDWWGRTTSGQALYMDGVIQEIAEQME